jgi:hypothetical protein
MTTIAYILTGIIALGALLYLAAVGFLWAMNKSFEGFDEEED